ncbi:MAG: FAD-binding oxidoreductase [Anaerolineae bacterium]|jgi:FAD/FMN-containing dehydrogenase/Fe-S oxidoreductase|nr:FAD-binding oxidoreductase [Anaerolineae bacterium]
MLSPEFIHELQRATLGDFRTDDITRTLYSTDASIYKITPKAVFIPRHQEDLHAAVEISAKYGIPILPRGSGSSLAGQAVGDALILELSRYLDKILDVDAEARTATVEPGVILSDLNLVAAKFGLGFGPDPASADRATMGGVIGNNATGAHSIRHGMAADHLLSTDVILADGTLTTFDEKALERAKQLAEDAQLTSSFHFSSFIPPANLEATIYSAALHIRKQYNEDIRQRWVKTWRNTSGYRLNYLLPWSPSRPPQWEFENYPNLKPSTLNLAPLMAGSEGTLALIRKMTVNLVSVPKEKVLVILSFKSIVEAVEAVPAILERNPSAVELFPKSLIDLAREVPAYAPLIKSIGDVSAEILVVEFAGENLKSLEKQAKALGNNLIVADKKAQANIWKVRKVGLGILSTSTSSTRGVTFIEDCAVPIEKLGDYVRGMNAIFKQHNTEGVFYAHASAGCLHMRPVLNLQSIRGRQDLRKIAEAALSLVLSLGGAMTGEHGDGLSRSEFLEKIYGEEITDAFRLLKNAADPQNLLNPGKIVSPLKMDKNLRYGEGYAAKPYTVPVLDFSSQGGLVNAIENCNGAGVCRKFDGTMCPTFQASREESHSTRGRANLLRDLISRKDLTTKEESTRSSKQIKSFSSRSSRLGSSLEDAVFASLNLCLACKGCKSECPSGVDMAKLKYEFTNYYYKTHSHRLRDYLFGYIAILAKLGAPFGKKVNQALGNKVLANLVKKIFGIAPERALPKFEKIIPDTSSSIFEGEIVLYLPDPFTRYFEPEIEQATLKILRAAGLRVIILPILGAGRTLISKGFLEPAKKHAKKVRDEIAKVDPDGKYPVLGVEPSEIYTLKDEYLDFFPDDKEMQALNDRSYLVDEFLLRINSDSETYVMRIANIAENEIQEKKLIENTKNKSAQAGSKVSLHGHCYQKARPPANDGLPVGQEATAVMLRTVGYEVEIIPSGCCGMAGSFGYEEEHYELSMKVGELVLFPEIRKLEGEVPVLAPGTSCREQIKNGTEIMAAHPLIYVASLLPD